MNHVKILKGWPPRDAPSKLVQLWYKSFPPDQRGLVEMKNPTRLTNNTSNAWSCAQDQILENINLRNMILDICTGRYVKYFREMFLPVREHTWLIGSGGFSFDFNVAFLILRLLEGAEVYGKIWWSWIIWFVIDLFDRWIWELGVLVGVSFIMLSFDITQSWPFNILLWVNLIYISLPHFIVQLFLLSGDFAMKENF